MMNEQFPSHHLPRGDEGDRATFRICYGNVGAAYYV